MSHLVGLLLFTSFLHIRSNQVDRKVQDLDLSRALAHLLSLPVSHSLSLSLSLSISISLSGLSLLHCLLEVLLSHHLRVQLCSCSVLPYVCHVVVILLLIKSCRVDAPRCQGRHLVSD